MHIDIGVYIKIMLVHPSPREKVNKHKNGSRCTTAQSIYLVHLDSICWCRLPGSVPPPVLFLGCPKSSKPYIEKRVKLEAPLSRFCQLAHRTTANVGERCFRPKLKAITALSSLLLPRRQASCGPHAPVSNLPYPKRSKPNTSKRNKDIAPLL